MSIDRRSDPIYSLRELLRLSEVLLGAQDHLRTECRRVAGVDIVVSSEPSGVDIEHRAYAVVDRTGGTRRTLYGPVEAGGLDLIADTVRRDARRWVECHARRRAMRAVGSEDE